jgi:hypothetical protein
MPWIWILYWSIFACKSCCTHPILVYRVMLTVVTMVATNQFLKDFVYLRTITKKLCLSEDTLQYMHIHLELSQFTWSPEVVSWLLACNLTWWITTPYSTQDYKATDSLVDPWQDLHDDDKTCMQSSYWELILENGQWLGCWITDGLCALLVTSWTGIHGFGYFSPLIRIAPFSAHKLIRQDTAVLHQAIIV